MRSELSSHFADEKTDVQKERKKKKKGPRSHSLFISDLGVKTQGGLR